MSGPVYATSEFSTKGSLDYRVFFTRDGKPISPFHDIPLFASASDKSVFNMVVEIPRWTNAKLEIATGEPLNPIRQDAKKGKLRYVRNCFPHHGYIANYGCLPQTWEDPARLDDDTGGYGDGDPIDVVEIGEAVGYTGQIKKVKILGIMALVDEGETDWKVLAIDVGDPLAGKMNDVEDVEHYMPGLVRAINEWFRIYKIPDGKAENHFAFNGAAKNRAFATDVVMQTHEAWKRLVRGEIPGKTDKYDIEITNTMLAGTPGYVAAEAVAPLTAAAAPAQPPAVEQSVNKWYFISC
ncbi:inorganic diphosphatase [Ramicandelaber brevisporus]|nr:inorganic diphosphatase [Ramicandelaber brevisporus]